jgi:hypothetical protein
MAHWIFGWQAVYDGGMNLNLEGTNAAAIRTEAVPTSLGYQLAAPIGGGLVPVIAAAIVSRNRGATWPVSVRMIAIALMTILAVLVARETAPLVANAQRRD